VPKAPAPAAAKPAAPGAAASPHDAAKPPAPAAAKAPEIKPPEGPFTLAQATQGLFGSGPLRASIELEQNGKALGTLRCELFADKAPLTVANFVGLARGVRPFRDPRSGQWLKRPLYDGSQLHRVIPNFMIQGGDPWCLVDAGCGGRHGTGDPGYALPDEIHNELRFDRGGRLGMSLRGEPNTAGSQFFVTERETPWLSGNHTVFGQCEPVELIANLSRVETQGLDVPKVPVRIKRVAISRLPGQTTAAPSQHLQ